MKPGKQKPPRFDQKKDVRAIARERVGTVKAARVIEPKTRRKRPKYKQSLEAVISEPRQ
jgi:hypothetical protein